MDEFENRPLLIYDGECEFCVKWAHKFKVMAGKYITFIPLQNLPVNYEYATRAACLKSVQYIDIDNRISKVPKQFSNCFTQQIKGHFYLPVTNEYQFLDFLRNMFIAW